VARRDHTCIVRSDTYRLGSVAEISFPLGFIAVCSLGAASGWSSRIREWLNASQARMIIWCGVNELALEVCSGD
jgi:hypothetical protein